MGKYSILLCDSDAVYAKRLAAGLKGKFREQIQIRTSSHLSESEIEHSDVHLILGNQIPDGVWQKQHPECVCLRLTEPDVQAAESIACQEMIFKYQSVSAIARALASYLPVQQANGCSTGQGQKQLWYGVVSPTRHSSMIPFACTLAAKLGEGKRVLLLVLMEFSGISSLLDIDDGCGMESFLFRLRKRESVEQVAFPTVCVLENFALLNGPKNPKVLYELNETDIFRLIERIHNENRYDCIVWVGGNMMRGIEHLFSGSKQVFSLEKKDVYSHCCQREFEAFFAMQQEQGQTITTVCPGEVHCEQKGLHLLWQWKNSALGDLVERLLKGEEEHGTANGQISQ